MKTVNIRIPQKLHTKHRDQMDPFFPVVEDQLYRKSNNEDTNLRILVNGTTDKVIRGAVVAEGYKVTTHKEASDMVRSFLEEIGLEYESRGAATSNNGARFFETFIFPKLAFNPASEVASTAFDNYQLKRDDMIPTITAINSYNKTSPVAWNYGMLQVKCTNGMCIPVEMTKLSFKHNQAIETKYVRETLLRNLERSQKLTEMVYRKLNGEDGILYLERLMEGGFTNKFKKALIDKLNASDNTFQVKYDEEKNEEGKVVGMKIKGVVTKASAYAMYNVATDVASHALPNRSDSELASRRIASLFIPKIAK